MTEKGDSSKATRKARPQTLPPLQPLPRCARREIGGLDPMSGPSADDIEVPRSDLELVKMLDAGSFGAVYIAKRMSDRTLVAVKVIKQAGEKATVSFKEEIRIMASLRHPNIVPVWGATNIDSATSEEIMLGTLRRTPVQER